MTIVVEIKAKSGPPNKAVHVEVFTHTDRQQIVVPEQCFTLKSGESRDVTLYEGFGFRANEIDLDLEAAQTEIPVHPSYEGSMAEEVELGPE